MNTTQAVPHKHHYQLEHKLRSKLRTIHQLHKPRYKPRLLLRSYRLVIALPIDVRLATIFAKTVKPFRLRCKAAPTEDCIINQRQLDRARRARYTICLFTAFFRDLIHVTFATAVPLSSLGPRRLRQDRRVADNLQINHKAFQNIPEQIQRQFSYIKALYQSG